jgi:AcrR family transcriptional regulator
LSPQRSNRSTLVEGTLRCLERLPLERITARAIAEESGANLASIAYHFGSKDELVTEAVILGLDRWLEEIDARLGDVTAGGPADRFQRAWGVVETGGRRHAGLVRNFFSALAKAQHDPSVRERLAGGFARSRPRVAAVIGLPDDAAGVDAAGLVHALFYGMLLQGMLDPELAIEGDRMRRAQGRLRELLPG